MAGRRRELSAEERELWGRITRSTRPLFAGSEAIPAEADRVGDAGAPPERPRRPAQAPGHTARRPEALPVGSIDRRTEQRLRRGAIDIDGRLDLHGLTQRRAHAALCHFVGMAQKRGWRTVLVITGKGGPETGRDHDNVTGEGRGVLNRQVPMWLNSAEVRPFVSGFSAAHPRHGGRGALYVRIRRLR